MTDRFILLMQINASRLISWRIFMSLSVVIVMDEPTYTFCLSLFRKDATYRLTDHALPWREGSDDGELAFTDIRRIRIYESPGMPTFRRCIVTPRTGRSRVLSSNHFVGGRRFESRLKSYQPFVEELLRRISKANPNVEYITGLGLGTWITFTLILAAILATGLLSLGGIAASAIEGGELVIDVILLVFVGVIFAVFVPPMWRSVRRNRPRRFDPHSENPLPSSV
jgi:hypothetical protein